ncbi:MAG TPA: c-type cytochrome, partial [Candidatus Binatia bacterium]|nr:c-type cytochrome [Candidatus Binatia bacterium]
MRNAKRYAAILSSVVVLCAAWSVLASAATEPLADTAGVRRVLTLLSVVAEEYREGVVDGQVVLPIEYQEAGVFLREARQRLETLPGIDAARFRPSFDALNVALEDKIPLASFREKIDDLRQAVTASTGVSEEVFPPAPPSAARGRILFAENCVSCHGEHADGKGSEAARLRPAPANFTDPNFIRVETPFDFFHIISVGKGTSQMPAWGDVFSLQERWDLVSYLWTVLPGKAGLAEGQGVYLAHCANCHGATGDARGAYSGNLITPAPRLDSAEALARKADQDLFRAVAHGVPGSAMPGFARVLDDEEMWAAATFVRALSLGGIDAALGTPASPGQAGRHFRGLLGLLGDEYRKASVDDRATAELEHAESLILLDQLERQAARVGGEVGIDGLPQRLRAIRQAIEARHPAPEVVSQTSSLAHEIEARLPAAEPQAPATQGGDALAETRRLLEEALAAYERNDERATYLVSDAYFQFEPLEKPLALAHPEVTRRVEGRFLELRTLMAKPGAVAEARALVATIGSELDAARGALHPESSRYTLAVQSATIILREGFEVVLILGALLAYVVKAGHPSMRRSVWMGAVAGLLASVATAYAFVELLEVSGTTVETLEGATMLLAALVLFSVSYWLISKAEAEKWQRYIQGKVSSALERGSAAALAGAAFLAVYREGVETVLFYRALAASAGSFGSLVAGLAIGIVLLVFLYIAFQRL